MIDFLFHALHPDDPLYDEAVGGHLWKLLSIWQNIGHELGINVRIEFSPNLQRYQKQSTQILGKSHPFVDRTRTVLEVNGHLIFIDARDHHSVGAKAKNLRQIFTCIIKFQGRRSSNGYELPFTYFTERDHDLLMKYREQRKQIMENRDFQHSIIWTGSAVDNTPLRKMVTKLVNQCELSKVGRCKDVEEYLDLTSRSLVGVEACRNGQFSQRDMDLLAIGTPFFCKTFNIVTHNPLVPNVHYYSIGGDEVGMRKTLNHFLPYFEPTGQLREFTDEEWETYRNISQRGMEWFDKNASSRGSLQLLVDILTNQGIIK